MGLEHLILSLLKTHRGKIIVSLLCIAASGFFGLLFWPNIADSRKLRNRHEICTAQVIDSRHDVNLHGGSNYDLRYQFRLQRHGRVFVQTERGPLSRKELWSTLPHDEWEAALERGTVQVAYNPDDPTLNSLVQDLKSDYPVVLIAGIVSGVLLFISTAWFLSLVIKQ